MPTPQVTSDSDSDVSAEPEDPPPEGAPPALGYEEKMERLNAVKRSLDQLVTAVRREHRAKRGRSDPPEAVGGSSDSDSDSPAMVMETHPTGPAGMLGVIERDGGESCGDGGDSCLVRVGGDRDSDPEADRPRVVTTRMPDAEPEEAEADDVVEAVLNDDENDLPDSAIFGEGVTDEEAREISRSIRSG